MKGEYAIRVVLCVLAIVWPLTPKRRDPFGNQPTGPVLGQLRCVSVRYDTQTAKEDECRQPLFQRIKRQIDKKGAHRITRLAELSLTLLV